MLRSSACLLLCIAFAGCNDEERAREDLARAEVANTDPTPEPTARPATPLPPSTAKPTAAAMPEPTTPEQIDAARKQAMIDGRDRDVIKYCEMAKIDVAKTDPQVLLGCALASCRVGQAEQARTWSKTLPKALKDQAIKICMANQVPL